MLCHKTKGVLAVVYLVSILVTIYSSQVLKSYVVTISALLVEVVCLLYFVCSFFPGGTAGMNYLLSFIWRTIKG